VSSRILYNSAVFCSAFLLFLIEPIAARQILPALGGSSAVWMTCLVFFQLMLLLGYLYAHWSTSWLSKRLSARQQEVFHVTLLAAAVLSLVANMYFHADLSGASQHPVAAIFTVLGGGIGLPFLLLASTSPLMQVWLARREQAQVRFRLFAMSNAGSLLALLLYPTLVEPYLPVHLQKLVWMIGFLLFAILFSLIALQKHASVSIEAPAPEGPAASLRQRLTWFLLPMAAAMQLSAVTGYLSQNIAAIPLLWILPLAAYLLTFILAFHAPNLYRRWLIVRFLVVLLASLGYMLTKTDMSLPIALSVGFFLVEAFFACWFCHAETYRLRPDRPTEATLFYLLIAAGGVTGAFLIGIACPLLFRANYDIALAFAATAAVALLAVWNDGWPQRLLWSTGVILLGVLLGMMHTVYTRDSLVEVRNFYAALRVRESLYPPEAFKTRTLLNGTVQHGTQWFATEYRKTPTTYYGFDSGVGLALRNCCSGQSKRVGVIGLGVGTLAAYGQPGDHFRFYEINPQVEPIARNLFTYIRDSTADTTIVQGDARISLTQEQPQNFDLIAVDAFTGDAIPLHLLTSQAMVLYRRHLAQGGILAFHVSNQYLNLPPEISLLARSADMKAGIVHSPSIDSRGEFSATWVLLTDNQSFWELPEIAKAARPIPPVAGLRLWTDDYSSLLPILSWRGGN